LQATVKRLNDGGALRVAWRWHQTTWRMMDVGGSISATRRGGIDCAIAKTGARETSNGVTAYRETSTTASNIDKRRQRHKLTSMASAISRA